MFCLLEAATEVCIVPFTGYAAVHLLEALLVLNWYWSERLAKSSVVREIEPVIW